MTTLAKAYAAWEEPVAAKAYARVTKPRLEVVAREAAPAKAEAGMLKTVALGLAAPFLGLAAVVAFPLIGLAIIARYAAAAAWHRRVRIATFVKNVTLFFAAPVVGLVYAALFPVIGLGMVAWTAGKALRARR